MKLKNILTGIILLSSFHIYGQFEPPSLNFLNGLTENWQYISYDSNFVKPFGSTGPQSPYWGRVPKDFILKDDKILILELSFTPRFGHDGYLVHKLNYKTGTLDWINYNNMYVGLDHYEDYSESRMILNENDEIELTGLRSFKNKDQDKYGWQYYGSTVVRTVDFNTGVQLDLNYGTEEIKERAGYNELGFMTAKNNRGQRLRIADRVTSPEGIIHENLDFHLIDDSLNIVYPPFDSILHNSHLPSQEHSLSYPVTIMHVSHDTILVVFGTNNPADVEYSPSELTLNWIYIGDKDNIHIVKSMDIVDNLYFPQLGEDFRSWMFDNGFVLTQRIISNEPDVPANKFTWLTWYDHSGNRMAKIDYLHIDDLYYINHTQPLFITDDCLYIAVRRLEELHTSYDIIKVRPGFNTYVKVGSMAFSHQANLDVYINNCMLLPNGQVLLGFWINQEIGDIVTNFVYFYSFNLEDIGITTSNNEVENQLSSLNIYPNPAKESLNVEFLNKFTGVLEITDEIGRKIQTQNVQNNTIQSVDVSNLESGIYFINAVDKKRYLRFESQSFVVE